MPTDKRLVDLPLGNEGINRTAWSALIDEINTKGAGALQGTAAARPAPSALLERFFYWATDTQVRSYCDGTTWLTVPAAAPLADSAPPAIADAGAVGTSTDKAREDHTHAPHPQMARKDGAQTFAGTQTFSGEIAATTITDKFTSKAAQTGAVTINCNDGGHQELVMTGNITGITFSNVPASGRSFAILLELTHSGGARTVAWPASVSWPGSVAPTLSGSGKKDFITLVTRDGGTTWRGFPGGLNF